jgi:hypothetical protein
MLNGGKTRTAQVHMLNEEEEEEEELLFFFFFMLNG